MGELLTDCFPLPKTHAGTCAHLLDKSHAAQVHVVARAGVQDLSRHHKVSPQPGDELGAQTSQSKPLGPPDCEIDVILPYGWRCNGGITSGGWSVVLPSWKGVLHSALFGVEAGCSRAYLLAVDGAGPDEGVVYELSRAPDEGQELVVIQAPHPM